jgi:hypothetical protein
MEHDESLIYRVYGLHKVELPAKMIGTKKCCGSYVTIYFIVMDNVFRDYRVGNRYDLKGSRKGRDQKITIGKKQ